MTRQFKPSEVWSNARGYDQCGHCGVDMPEGIFEHAKNSPVCGAAWQVSIDRANLAHEKKTVDEARQSAAQFLHEENWGDLWVTAQNAHKATRNIKTLVKRISDNMEFINANVSGETQ